jgi:hypothetical protein
LRGENFGKKIIRASVEPERLMPSKKGKAEPSSGFVSFRPIAGNANAEKDQITLANVRDPLPAERGDEDEVAGTNFLRWQIADLHPTIAFQDDVPLADAAKAMPASGHSRFNSGASDGSFTIRWRVAKLGDVAFFRRMKLAVRAERKDSGIHTGTGEKVTGKPIVTCPCGSTLNIGRGTRRS